MCDVTNVDERRSMEVNDAADATDAVVNSRGKRLEITDGMDDKRGKDELSLQGKPREPGVKYPATIDKGWAWMVLLGAVIQMILNIGIIKCSGIFFVAFQKKFGSNSSVTSLITTVQFAVYSLSALLVMNVVVKKFGCRTVVMIGGATNAVAYIITALADDIWILFFSHGVLHGIGSACIEPCSYVMVGSYFERRLGLANSISNSGGSLGALILAPLLTITLEFYGYTGLMLIVSALMLNCCVSGALNRPQTYYTRQGDEHSSPNASKMTHMTHSGDTTSSVDIGEEDEETTKFIGNNITSASHSRPQMTRQRSVPASHGGAKEEEHKLYLMPRSNMSDKSTADSILDSTGSPNSLFARQFSFRERSNTGSFLSKVIDSISKSNVAIYGSADHVLSGSMGIIPSVYRQTSTNTTDTKLAMNDELADKSDVGICKACLTLFDFQLFKNPVFVAFIAATMLLCSSNALVTIYIAPFAVDIGLTEMEIGKLLTIYGAVDLCARILTGVISDRGWMRRSNIIATTSLIIAVFTHLSRYFVNFQWLVVYAVVYGLFSGVYFCLVAVVIVDYFTVAKLHSCIGFTAISSGGGASAAFYLVGKTRDVSGSYVLPFHLIGVMGVVGAGLMFSLPLIEKLYKGRRGGTKDSAEGGE